MVVGVKQLFWILLAAGLMLAVAAVTSAAGGLGLFLPVPLSVLVALRGLPAGLGAAAIFAVLWSELVGARAGLLGSAGALAVGLVYGVGLRRQRPPGRTILIGAAAAAAGILWHLPALADAWRLWRDGLAEGVEATVEFYRNSGLLAATAGQEVSLEKLEGALENLALHLGRVFPAMVAWELLGGAALVYLLSRWLVGRRMPVPDLPSFLRWQLPWPFAWGVIAGLAAFLFGDWRGNTLLVILGENILVGYLPVLLVSGLAVAGYLYRYLALPPFIKATGLLAMLLYLPLGALVVVLLGLFDPLLNFRRLEIDGGENR